MKNSTKKTLDNLRGKLSEKATLLRHFFRGEPSLSSQTDTALSNLASNSSPRKQALVRGVSIRSVRLVWITFASLFFLFLWAAFANLDVIVRGSGQVVPSQRVQQLQNLEGGILREILVYEGQSVEQGDLLARIDNESAGSQYREAMVRSLDHQASIARLQALIDDAEPLYPPEVLVNSSLVTRHTNILNAMRAQLNSELNVLELQADARKHEAAELEARKKHLASGLKIAQEQRRLAAKALAEKAYSALDFLNLEQRVLDLDMEITALEHSIPRLHIEAQEMQERITQLKAENTSQNSQEIGEIQARLVSLQELLKAGSDKVRRTEMHSPVRGIIKRIYTSTVGGVVAPGATIMDIVPIDESLIIEARFSPADIGFLYPGLKAIVRLTAYDFAIYGSMEARVEQISADTLENSQGEVFYNVKVRTTHSTLNNQGENLPIMAGMQAEVDVMTGKKTVLNYILKPLLKVRDRAFREQ